jgi:hypothetical protein
VILFDGLLLFLGGLMLHQGREVPALSIFGAFAILAAWQIALLSMVGSFARSYRWEAFFRPTHYVQAVLHTSIYIYLGLYWEGVPRYAPLIVTQIVFGYLCDMLIAWSRGRVWRVGLGVLPIVLSTNLFLWFRESAYYLQLALMALTFLGKEFITWNYEGRRRHIFNPSAFSLSVASIVLLATNTVDMTHAVDITAAFDAPPNYFEVIFFLGLVVQTLFIVTPVSLGAALAMYLIYFAFQAVDIDHTPFSASVFLGMTFLVTDPATSPRSHFGRFLFGLAYGVGVTVTFVLLRLAHRPAIFDKLLVVCVINLLVPAIDRLCRRLARHGNGDAPPGGMRPSQLARFGWLTAYIALIAFMMPDLKSYKPPETRPSLLPPPVGYISPDVWDILRSMVICRKQFPEAYKAFGFRAEIENFGAIRDIYRRGPDVWLAEETRRARSRTDDFLQVIVQIQTLSEPDDGRPMRDVVDRDENRLLSWRFWLVDHSLPLPQDSRGDYKESWRHPRNLRLAPTGSWFVRRSDSRRSIGSAATGDDGTSPPKTEDATTILAITGPGTIFGEGTPMRLDDAPGSAIVLVESRNSGVHWMAPGDLDIRTMPQTINDPEGRGISGETALGFHIAFADGEVWLLSYDTPFAELSKFFLADNARHLDRDAILGKYCRWRMSKTT